MKKYFYTGLIALLPIVLTLYIFNWLLRIVMVLLSHSLVTMAIKEILIEFVPKQETAYYMQLLVYILSFITMIVLITFVGFTLKMVFFKEIMKIIQRTIIKIPLIKQVYTTISQIIEITMSDKDKTYQKAVLLEYPRKGIYSIGFLTSLGNPAVERNTKTKEKLCNVFIPTSPNPTSGMFVAVPLKDIKILDMKIDDAIKMIISGGVILPEEVLLEGGNENEAKDNEEN